MIIFITGTPGTGKTTVSRLLKEQLSYTMANINEIVEDRKLYTGRDEERGYKIVDIPSLCLNLKEIINNLKDGEDLVVEGHLSHFCNGADMVIVLRAHPNLLFNRLKSKGFSDTKIRENLEAEALDICAYEAFQRYGDKTQEIDTTNKDPQDLIDLIKKVLNGEKTLPAGQVDFSEYLCS